MKGVGNNADACCRKGKKTEGLCPTEACAHGLRDEEADMIPYLSDKGIGALRVLPVCVKKSRKVVSPKSAPSVHIDFCHCPPPCCLTSASLAKSSHRNTETPTPYRINITASRTKHNDSPD